MNSFPLHEIILYIALLFAPADTTKITVAGPDLSAQLTHAETNWKMANASFSIADDTLVREENAAKTSQPLAEYLPKELRSHDWAKTKKITLPMGGVTVEKKASGFIVRINDRDPTVRAREYDISYASATSIKVNVIGQVINPGAVVLPASKTLTAALAAAGGVTRVAKGPIRVARGVAGEKAAVSTYDLRAIKKGEIADPILQDNDTVFVPEIIF